MQMTDQLKDIYVAAGKADAFFDVAVPVDLFRGQKKQDFLDGKDLFAPDMGGWVNRDGKVREPDVKTAMVDGKLLVKGCRCIHGSHRGISMGDRTPVFARGKSWRRFRLPAGTPLPEALAITRDAERRVGTDIPIHYTLAPKDDMEFGLFLVWLRALATHATEID